MKRTFSWFSLFFAFLLICLDYTQGIYTVDTMVYASSPASVEVTSPLVQTVPSTITSTEDGIRVGVERIADEKYFILYSTMSGDWSNMNVTLIIENMNKEMLNKDTIAHLTLVDDNNNIYLQTPYYELKDFPGGENALGWRMTFFCKFARLPENVKKVDGVFQYDGKVFLLEDIILP